MHNKVLAIFIAFLWAADFGAAYAQDIGPELVPKAVLDKFQQKYPQAKDMQAESVTHFRNPLIKVVFKNGEEQAIEYFRPSGAFFVNGFSVNEDEIPLELLQNMKNEFSDYRIKAASLIVNPNGVGREYEVDVGAAGANWEFIADESGTILGKTQE